MNPPLRILITNVGIANRTGTEIVVMDLASSLARMGHLPMVWAPQLDPVVAAPMAALGIPVVSRLNDLPGVPDIIHGHNHLETVEALRWSPGVPAIFVCHSGYWWHDAPPRHPRIRRYVAVDEFCRERLAGTPWMENDQVEVILNAVDLDRFQPRPPLPQRPRRALVFSNNAGPGTHAEQVGEACRRLGIGVETVGSAAGNASTEPERLLPAYDLVFAKARCAIEAMATGCAVILCDTTGLGSIVASANVRELRRWNFGFRVLKRPLCAELVAEEIQRYDPRDAGEVTTYIRETAGLNKAVAQYLMLYRAVLDGPQPASAGVDWHPVTEPVQVGDQATLRLRLINLPESLAPRRHFTFDVDLFNGASIPIATSAPWPCMLMYRWLCARTGNIVVQHGMRSIIQPPAWTGMEQRYSMRAVAPDEPGEYILHATIIQEGWRWLDFLAPAVYAESPISVVPELPAPKACHETI